MNCDICGGGEKKIVDITIPHRTASEPPVRCYWLECGHRWHVVYSGNKSRHTECQCSDYQKPARQANMESNKRHSCGSCVVDKLYAAGGFLHSSKGMPRV